MQHFHCVFTEYVSLQNKLLTRRTGNWQCWCQAYLIFYPTSSTLFHTSGPANDLWQIDKASPLRILGKICSVLISGSPNRIQLMHILLVGRKQNKRKTISFPSVYTHRNWNVSQQKWQNAWTMSAWGWGEERLKSKIKCKREQREHRGHLLLDMNLNYLEISSDETLYSHCNEVKIWRISLRNSIPEQSHFKVIPGRIGSRDLLTFFIINSVSSLQQRPHHFRSTDEKLEQLEV